ncbi:hypothetical protein GUJ93_ZPchr0012g19245 [Zizania palustris]|uniref:Uncharacterized protein n=1 Tax=Zizania palustris TaxID=103762 RepID=A0A8J6BSP2_ZIZPA|nr:hypothetical protein GUJ93_ZPchr0012g19245 [Zizania palustris]
MHAIHGRPGRIARTAGVRRSYGGQPLLGLLVLHDGPDPASCCRYSRRSVSMMDAAPSGIVSPVAPAAAAITHPSTSPSNGRAAAVVLSTDSSSSSISAAAATMTTGRLQGASFLLLPVMLTTTTAMSTNLVSL